MSLQENYRGIRKRLLNPPGGKTSTELDIISETKARRQDAERRAAERAEMERQRRIAASAEARRIIKEQIAAKWAAEEEAWIKGLEASGVRIRSIIMHCCRKYSMTPLEILSTRRTAPLCRARHIVMYLSCELTSRSTPEIGRCLGGRDHTTVLHGRKKVKAKIAADPAFAAEIEEIKAALQPAEEAA